MDTLYLARMTLKFKKKKKWNWKKEYERKRSVSVFDKRSLLFLSETEDRVSLRSQSPAASSGGANMWSFKNSFLTRNLIIICWNGFYSSFP